VTEHPEPWRVRMLALALMLMLMVALSTRVHVARSNRH
jgi:hypothetical protein